MKYFVGVILGVHCPHSTGYTKALLRKDAVDKKTIANINSHRIVSLNYIDDNEFAIRSHVWHDNMTIHQLRKKQTDLLNLQPDQDIKLQINTIIKYM